MNPLAPTAPITVTLLTWLIAGVITTSCPGTVFAQERQILVGMHLEKNSSVQPGLEVGYKNSSFLGGHPRFTLSYSTTRLATAFNEHILARDRFLVTSGWYFRPQKRIDPYIELQLGYARFDRENPELFALLDNDAAVASVLFGIELRYVRAVGVYGDFGYSILHSSTVYPFVASIGVHFNLSQLR